MSEAPFSHCGHCGSPGLQFDGAKLLHCARCSWRYYANPAAAAAAVLHHGGEILMVRRGRDPGSGLLDLPGGFVDPHESAEQALRRELLEELRLPLERFSYRASYPNRYRYANVPYTVVDLIFEAHLPHRPRWFDADEIAGLAWVDPRALDPAEIAFESIRRCLHELTAPPPTGSPN